MLEVCHVDHLERYRFVEQYAHCRRVLDVGCAKGYGTARLAHVAVYALGIDINERAIRYANRHYAGPRCHFMHVEVETVLGMEDKFDFVVSFEVIEHVPNPLAFLEQMASVLEIGGWAVFSTPNRLVSVPGGGVSDPTYLREFTPSEFVAVLEKTELEAEGLYGVHLGKAVWKRHAMRVRLGRMDVFGLKKLIPGYLKALLIRRLAAIHSPLSLNLERQVLESKGEVSPRGEVWIDEVLDGAYSQIAVCRKRA